MTHETKNVTLPSGATLPYVERGDRSGAPVLLLHGYTDSWRSFEPVLPYLPDSLRAFALTQRGHGDADRPATGYRPDDFAADVGAFMDALGLESAVVAGHSMGAAVARRFAALRPERVRGLVLMGSFLRLKGNPAIAELCDAVRAIEDPIDPDFVREFQLSTLARPVPDGLVDLVVRESLKLPARVWKEVLEPMVEEDDTGDLGRISAPTLVAWGDRDAFVPRSDQDGLVAAVPRAELVVYPGGHAFHWEDPRGFAADLAAFVEATAGSFGAATRRAS
jgi:pimeloyl-ACP methyl ester carboxylesterase